MIDPDSPEYFEATAKLLVQAVRDCEGEGLPEDVVVEVVRDCLRVAVEVDRVLMSDLDDDVKAELVKQLAEFALKQARDPREAN